MAREYSEMFEAYVAPARARPQFWRLIAGFALMSLVWFAATIVVGVPDILGPLDARGQMLAFLISFCGLVFGAWLAARLLHKRNFRSLIGPRGFWPSHFGYAAAFTVAMSIVSIALFILRETPVQNQPLSNWLISLPLLLPLIFVQTTAEELAFRGYLMQQLAARFRFRAVWLVLPSVLFGLLHWNPWDYGDNAWLVVLTTVLIGLVLGDVTARTGNLSAAMGLHFANNVGAMLIVAYPSSLSAFALLVTRTELGEIAAVRITFLTELALICAGYGLWYSRWGRHLRLHSVPARPI